MSSPVIHQFEHVNIFDYNTFDLLSTVRVAGSATFNLTGELVEQMTGPSYYSVETEVNRFTAEASILFKSYESKLLEILTGSVTNEIKPMDGMVTGMTDLRGGPIFDPKFISGITITASGTILPGQYRVFVKDASASTITVDRLSGPGFNKGIRTKEIILSSDATFDSGFGFTIATSATYDSTVTEDNSVGIFRVFDKGQEAFESTIGGEDNTVPKVKIITKSRNLSDGRWYELYLPNCIFPGLAQSFGDEFSENEVAGKMIYDSKENMIARVTYFSPLA